MKKISWAVWVAVGLSVLFWAVLLFINLVKVNHLEATLGWNGWTDLGLVALDLVFVAPAAGVFWIVGAILTIRKRRSGSN